MAATIAQLLPGALLVRCIRGGWGLSFRPGSVNPDAVLIPHAGLAKRGYNDFVKALPHNGTQAWTQRPECGSGRSGMQSVEVAL